MLFLIFIVLSLAWFTSLYAKRRYDRTVRLPKLEKLLQAAGNGFQNAIHQIYKHKYRWQKVARRYSPEVEGIPSTADQVTLICYYSNEETANREAVRTWFEAEEFDALVELCLRFLKFGDINYLRWELDFQVKPAELIQSVFADVQSRYRACLETYESDGGSFIKLNSLIWETRPKGRLLRLGVTELSCPAHWNEAVTRFIISPRISDFWEPQPMETDELWYWAGRAIYRGDVVLAKIVLAHCRDAPKSYYDEDKRPVTDGSLTLLHQMLVRAGSAVDAPGTES